MDYRAFFKGSFINAAELGTKTPTLRIAAIKLVEVPVIGKDGDVDENKTKAKGVIYFAEVKERGWVLNRTNAQLLAAMWGVETDAWLGKRVTLHAVPVRVGNKTEPGIRVKGSPDISKGVSVEVKLPRRRPVMVRLEVTGKGQAAAAPAFEEPPETESEAPTEEELQAAGLRDEGP